MAARMILVVGGALAGPVAAARATETDERARITLLERGKDANYSVGGIARLVSGEAHAPVSAHRECIEARCGDALGDEGARRGNCGERMPG